jgi:hypothetical protein
MYKYNFSKVRKGSSIRARPGSHDGAPVAENAKPD